MVEIVIVLIFVSVVVVIVIVLIFVSVAVVIVIVLMSWWNNVSLTLLFVCEGNSLNPSSRWGNDIPGTLNGSEGG